MKIRHIVAAFLCLCTVYSFGQNIKWEKIGHLEKYNLQLSDNAEYSIFSLPNDNKFLLIDLSNNKLLLKYYYINEGYRLIKFKSSNYLTIIESQDNKVFIKEYDCLNQKFTRADSIILSQGINIKCLDVNFSSDLLVISTSNNTLNYYTYSSLSNIKKLPNPQQLTITQLKINNSGNKLAFINTGTQQFNFYDMLKDSLLYSSNYTIAKINDIHFALNDSLIALYGIDNNSSISYECFSVYNKNYWNLKFNNIKSNTKILKINDNYFALNNDKIRIYNYNTLAQKDSIEYSTNYPGCIFILNAFQNEYLGYIDSTFNGYDFNYRQHIKYPNQSTIFFAGNLNNFSGNSNLVCNNKYIINYNTYTPQVISLYNADNGNYIRSFNGIFYNGCSYLSTDTNLIYIKDLYSDNTSSMVFFPYLHDIIVAEPVGTNDNILLSGYASQETVIREFIFDNTNSNIVQTIPYNTGYASHKSNNNSYLYNEFVSETSQDSILFYNINDRNIHFRDKFYGINHDKNYYITQSGNYLYYFTMQNNYPDSLFCFDLNQQILKSTFKLNPLLNNINDFYSDFGVVSVKDNKIYIWSANSLNIYKTIELNNYNISSASWVNNTDYLLCTSKDIDAYLLVNCGITSLGVPEIPQDEKDFTLSAFPNPATDYIKIDLNGIINIKAIQAFNVFGSLVPVRSFYDSANLIINTKDLESGTYYLNLITENNIIKHVKFIVIK